MEPNKSDDFISQDDVLQLLRITEGVLKRWRDLGVIKFVKFDYQEKFKYLRSEILDIRTALLVLGCFGLSLHSVPPLREEGSPMISGEAAGDLIPESEAIRRLGISKRIASRWRVKGIGPRIKRFAYTEPYHFQARDVEEIRSALLTLGRYKIALPGVEPLKA
jgi:hypothetical protein